MSQLSSNSSANFNPVQLNLFVGEFAAPKNDQNCKSDSASGSIEEENSGTDGNLDSPHKDIKLSGVESSASNTQSLCPLANEFMQVFEAVSGWEVQFQESADRGSASSIGESKPRGKFEIIDMSIDWPTQTPTMHRGKCDQLINLFSDLYGQATATQADLDKARNSLTALTKPTEQNGHLVDSFAPSHQPSDTAEDFVLCQDNGFDSEYESAFVVKQEFDSTWLPEKSFWNGWSIAGTSGIVGESYLDWSQQGDVLTVYVGRIESGLGVSDTESILEVNALSREFKVCEDNSLGAFFFWDRRGGQLRSVEPGTWQTLYSDGAIVVSTDPTVQMPDLIVNAGLGAAPFTAEQLAAAIESKIGADHRVVVIKCD